MGVFILLAVLFSSKEKTVETSQSTMSSLYKWMEGCQNMGKIGRDKFRGYKQRERVNKRKEDVRNTRATL